MADLRCPGRVGVASLDSTVMACPNCGHEVELFGDEVKVHCHCGTWVFRDALPACAKWCPEAERCFGQAGSFPQGLKGTCDPDRQKEQEERLRELQRRVANALAQCGRREVKEPG